MQKENQHHETLETLWFCRAAHLKRVWKCSICLFEWKRKAFEIFTWQRVRIALPVKNKMKFMMCVWCFLQSKRRFKLYIVACCWSDGDYFLVFSISFCFLIELKWTLSIISKTDNSSIVYRIVCVIWGNSIEINLLMNSPPHIKNTQGKSTQYFIEPII